MHGQQNIKIFHICFSPSLHPWCEKSYVSYFQKFLTLLPYGPRPTIRNSYRKAHNSLKFSYFKQTRDCGIINQVKDLMGSSDPYIKEPVQYQFQDRS